MSQSSPGEANEGPQGRGILTEADRDFLHGEKEELTEQSKRDTRYRIRKRLKNGILDLGVLSAHLEDKDRKRVFEDLYDDQGPPFIGGLFFLGVRGVLDITDSISEGVDAVEDIIEDAVFRALQDIDEEYMIEVDVHIDYEREKPDMEELLKKFEQNEENFDEFMYLLRNEQIEFELDNVIRLVKHAHGETDMNVGVGIGEEDGEYVEIDSGEDLDEMIEELREMWPTEDSDDTDNQESEE